MSKNSSKQSALAFIRQKCQQIIANPSQINTLNSIIQKYLQTDIPSSSQLYQKKLESFSEIAKLISALVKKSLKTQNAAISKFVQQKANLIIQIFITDQLKRALLNQEQFQIVAGIVSQILILLNDVNPAIFQQKFVSTVILQANDSQTLNTKSLASLYQNFSKSSLIEGLLQKISVQIEKISVKGEKKKQLESLSTFFANLPSFDLIQIQKEGSNPQSNKQKSFEDQIEEEKPKQQFKRKFQSTFLKLLPLIQPHKQIAVGLYRKLDSKILSKMNNPLILSDYFLDKFKQQPEIQIEVLSCLFILVGKFGLQFQNFYSQLEVLIKQKKDGKSVYQMKNSKRFFKLVESALRSSKVPFKTIETMTRTIMSQILEEESEFAFWALAFFFNLTKKHRKLLDIIKEIPELQLLTKHYNPRIRSLVNQLRKDLNKSEYLDIEKFSKIDCKKLTQKKVQELCQKLRQQDEAEFKIPGLFEDL